MSNGISKGMFVSGIVVATMISRATEKIGLQEE
jgi:hypothetical protein